MTDTPDKHTGWWYVEASNDRYDHRGSGPLIFGPALFEPTERDLNKAVRDVQIYIKRASVLLGTGYKVTARPMFTAHPRKE